MPFDQIILAHIIGAFFVTVIVMLRFARERLPGAVYMLLFCMFWLTSEIEDLYILNGGLSRFPHMLLLAAPIYTAAPTMIFAHIQEVQSGKPMRWGGINLLHFITPLLGLAGTLYFVQLPAADKINIFFEPEIPLHQHLVPMRAYINFVIIAVMVHYVVVILQYWRNPAIRAKAIEDHQSDLSHFVRRWSLTITTLLLVLAFSTILQILILSEELFYGTLDIIYLVLSIFFCVQLIHFYHSYALALNMADRQTTPSVNTEEISIADNESTSPTSGSTAKYARAALDQTEMTKIEAALHHTMTGDRLFLQADLNLTQLSAHLDIMQSKISQVLNTKLGCNFYEFVNRFRIEEAKKQLLSDIDKSILLVAYDSGFGSKSTFNSTFRRFEDQTPTQFRRAHI